MLATLGLAAVLAAQPAATVRSPYLDAVRRYGPGTEREAVMALRALRLTDPDEVSRELDARVCASLGVRTCVPQRLASLADDVRARIIATWRRDYPRALALHIEALAACHPMTEHAAIDLHRGVVLRLIARLDWMATQTLMPSTITTLPAAGRRLLVWALQFLRDEQGLTSTLDAFGADQSADVELRLVRADLDVLRSSPDALEATLRRRSVVAYTQREVMRAQEEQRVLGQAARGYEAVLAADATVVEAALRLGRVQVRQGRLEAAAARLRGLAGRIHDGQIRDARQAYLTALFLAEVEERLGRRAEAVAQYEAARRAWPAAQTPVLAMARLRALEGAHGEARAALTTLGRGAADEPSDPWHGFDNGQAWRLPAAIAALQASFEPL
jgi:tetratricopeptide (TPR) repeat protein